jgi:hypothetical protein
MVEDREKRNKICEDEDAVGQLMGGFGVLVGFLGECFVDIIVTVGRGYGFVLLECIFCFFRVFHRP